MSMYTNIPTDGALESMPELPTHLLEALELIMNNNIFQFSDTYWHQLSGMAMGTPPACMWATLFFNHHKEHCRTTYSQYLLDWARYIDDSIGIWNWTGTAECIQAFKDFSEALQGHHLRWEVNLPTHTVNYLDITLSIKDGKISSTLFEKNLHLYLYLPRSSAHPPGTLKGLIAGSLLCILQLTSNPHVRKCHVQNFYLRLRARGYARAQLLPLFEKYLQQYSPILNSNTPETTATAIQFAR